jgi:hypothetical protein
MSVLPGLLIAQSLESSLQELKKLPPVNVSRIFSDASSVLEVNKRNNNLLDSIVHKESRGYARKRTFEYDENGNAIVETFFQPNQRTGQWIQYKKNEFTYNADNLPSIIEVYEWNIRQWVPQQKKEIIYNSQGKMLLSIDYAWNKIVNGWQDEIQYKVVYDINDNPILATLYSRVNENDAWKAQEQKETNYDGNDNLILEINSIFDENTDSLVYTDKHQTIFCNPNIVTTEDFSWSKRLNDWVKEKSVQNVRNSKNYMTPIKIVTCDTLTDKCVENEKYEITVDAQGNVTSSVGYQLDENSDNWVKSQKHDYQYDKNNNLISIESYWLNEANEWEGNFKTTYTFDDNSRKTSEAHYDLDESNKKTWINGIKNEFTYSESGNILTDNAFEWKDNEWTIDYTETYYYREK